MSGIQRLYIHFCLNLCFDPHLDSPSACPLIQDLLRHTTFDSDQDSRLLLSDQCSCSQRLIVDALEWLNVFNSSSIPRLSAGLCLHQCFRELIYASQGIVYSHMIDLLCYSKLIQLCAHNQDYKQDMYIYSVQTIYFNQLSKPSLGDEFDFTQLLSLFHNTVLHLVDHAVAVHAQTSSSPIVSAHTLHYKRVHLLQNIIL